MSLSTLARINPVQNDVLNFWLGKINPLLSVDTALGKIVARKVAAKNAVSLTIQCNKHVAMPQPGQHVSIKVEVDGRSFTRSYSPSVVSLNPLCLEITVKKVTDGKVSTWLNQHASVGDVLEIGQPFGEFLWTEQQRPVVLLAAGSGITPIVSLLRAHLKNSQQPVSLHYWVKERSDAAFLTEFLALQQQYSNFSFYLYLTQQGAQHAYEREGRITAQPEFNQANVNGSIAYACGPHTFVQAAASLFKGKVAYWHEESFSLPELAGGNDETIQLTLLKQGRVLEIPNNQPILAALEAAGINRPYGCRMGVCNTCSCRKATGTSQNLLSGDSTHEEEAALKICISSAQSNIALDI